MNTKCLSLNLLTEMAKVRSNRKIEKPGSVGCSGIFLLLVANFQVVATSVTWTAPPPQWTQTDPNDIRTVDKPVLNGSTQVSLRWSYTLLAGLLLSTPFSIQLNDSSFDDIGTITGGNAVVFNKNDYPTRFNISRDELATLIINKVTEREEAVYQCKLTTDLNQWSYRIRVIVTVPIKLTSVRDQTVCEGTNTTLFCEATGKPTPSITLIRVLKDGSDGEVLPQGPTSSFSNINRTASGIYRCTAKNEYQTDSQVFKVNVTYPAKIVNLKSEHEVTAQQCEPLVCQAEGNPEPSYTWTPCDSQQSVCHQSVLHFQASNKSVYTFTCKVENYLSSDTRNTTVFIASDVINVTLVVIGVESNKLLEKLRETLKEIFAGKLDYESVEQKNIRETTKNSNGVTNVIVDVAMKFSSTVRERDVIVILRDAANSGGFGDFNVSSITGTRDTGIPATMTTTPTGSPNSK
ncbi:neural cell adhesion molecule 2-like isoform X2 [Orbicella faveolata]|uniref:neural cell adhesion molecule 2-like isoform X2 n=1 Tax=Orbicella faveolata TaxID=48498 RepID=UPI0009E286A0|nr:neural cell adhesion molecule 2-like isoform X2 [Orbicella faveolata]